jgi:alkylation response protein AidB-like acyl-CoA dehydrogenase
VTTDGDTLLELADAAEHRAELRAAADDLLAKEWSVERSRDLLETDGPTWATALWNQVRALGWADLLVDGTMADLCTVAEAVGASTAPLPLVTAAAARAAGAPADTPLTAVVPGTFRAARFDDHVELSGSQPFVAYADVASSLLVHARTDDGDDLVVTLPTDAPGIARAALRPLDVMPSAALELDAVRVPVDAVLATGAEAAAAAEETNLRLVLGWTAELTGVAAAANDAAAAYARERIAFGRPSGTFQAIKHRLVDQRAAIEVSRALVGRAAGALAASAPDRAALVALAAFWAADSLRAVPEGAVQVFGGIGYTWEHFAHVYLRRAAVLVALLGDRASHRDVAADWLRQR